jgi:hypothetical protein
LKRKGVIEFEAGKKQVLMRDARLLLAYDAMDFGGGQRQPDGPTLQALLVGRLAQSAALRFTSSFASKSQGRARPAPARHLGHS